MRVAWEDSLSRLEPPVRERYRRFDVYFVAREEARAAIESCKLAADAAAGELDDSGVPPLERRTVLVRAALDEIQDHVRPWYELLPLLGHGPLNPLDDARASGGMVKRLLELRGSLRQMAGVVDPHKAFREAIEGTARRVEDRGSELLTGYKPMHSEGLDGERLNVLARTLGLIGPDRCIVEEGETESDGDDRPSRWVRVHHPDPDVPPTTVIVWTPMGAHVSPAALNRIVDFLRAWGAKADKTYAALEVQAKPGGRLSVDERLTLYMKRRTREGKPERPTQCEATKAIGCSRSALTKGEAGKMWKAWGKQSPTGRAADPSPTDRGDLRGMSTREAKGIRRGAKGSQSSRAAAERADQNGDDRA